MREQDELRKKANGIKKSSHACDGASVYQGMAAGYIAWDRDASLAALAAAEYDQQQPCQA